MGVKDPANPTLRPAWGWVVTEDESGSSTYERKQTFDVRNYGTLLMGGSNDGTANATTIQAAINAAAAAGGGIVFIPGGGNAAKVRVTQVGIRAGVTLRGAGPGSTVLAGTNSSTNVIVIDETAGSVDQFVVEELKVEGGLDGLHFAHSNNTNQLSFARGVIRNVIAVNCARTGFYLDNGCLEYRLENCHAKSCVEDGFRYQSTDHFTVNCTAQASGFYGFRVNGANNRFANSKAFGGQKGWVIGASRHTLTGCEAQENSAGGFALDGADHVLSGCLADSNGGVGFDIGPTPDNHTLTGCHSTTTSGLAYSHSAGFRISSGGNRRVRLTGCSSRDAVSLDAASVVTGCTVDIDGSGFAGSAGTGVLASVSYALPADVTTTSATQVDVDATNLKVTFTAPTSGRVLVTLNANAAAGTTTVYTWNLRDASGDVPNTGQLAVYNLPSPLVRVSSLILVTGLTPGQSYTWKWGHGLSFGSNSSKIAAGAAVMTVQAA